MEKHNLVPYETIVRATSGEQEAVDEVLQHYSRQIRLAALFRFRFGEQET